jgi:hypothetical protein
MAPKLAASTYFRPRELPLHWHGIFWQANPALRQQSARRIEHL